MFKQNESKLDRYIRLVIGLGALLLGIFTAGTVQMVSFVFAFLGIFTGVTGFCAIYKILGINTNK
jgi:hypothetical protein